MSAFRYIRRNLQGETVWSAGVLSKEQTRSSVFPVVNGTMEIETDDRDLGKSRKLFTKLGEAYCTSLNLIEEDFLKKVRAQSHSLKELQGQVVQKTEGALPLFRLHGKTFEEQKDVIKKEMSDNPDRIAETLLYIQKRSIEIGAHMASFDLLHLGEQIELTVIPQNLKRSVLNIWHAFDDSIKDVGLGLKFKFSDEDAETHRLRLDYKSFDAGLYNFFDNTVKYALPYSDVYVFFIFNEIEKTFKVIFSMKSIRIEQDELESIFNMGTRGRHAICEKGSGIGMFVFKKALALNRINVRVDPEYQEMEMSNGRQYVLNKFILEGRLQN